MHWQDVKKDWKQYSNSILSLHQKNFSQKNQDRFQSQMIAMGKINNALIMIIKSLERNCRWSIKTVVLVFYIIKVVGKSAIKWNSCLLVQNSDVKIKKLVLYYYMGERVTKVEKWYNTALKTILTQLFSLGDKNWIF